MGEKGQHIFVDVSESESGWFKDGGLPLPLLFHNGSHCNVGKSWLTLVHNGLTAFRPTARDGYLSSIHFSFSIIDQSCFTISLITRRNYHNLLFGVFHFLI